MNRSRQLNGGYQQSPQTLILMIRLRSAAPLAEHSCSGKIQTGRHEQKPSVELQIQAITTDAHLDDTAVLCCLSGLRCYESNFALEPQSWKRTVKAHLDDTAVLCCISRLLPTHAVQ